MSSNTPFLLRNGSFARLWLGQILSQAGSRMYQIAIVWWIINHFPEAPGKRAALFLVIAALPSVIFARWIGQALDHYRVRSILLLADALNTLVVGVTAWALVASPDLAVEWLYLAGFLIAALQAITDPGLNKAVPEVVAEADIPSATAFQGSTISLGYFTGATLGAALIPALGVSGVIALNAVSYALSFLCVWSCRFHTLPAMAHGPAGAAPESAWKILGRFPLFKKLLFGFGMANLFCVPTFLILPLYVKEVLGSGATTVAWIESGLWSGILLGTFASRWIRVTEDPEKLGALCVFFLSIGLAGPSLVIGSSAYFAFVFLQGFAFSFVPVRFIALFQAGLPNEVKGRFFALLSAMLSFALPISQLGAGLLADVMPISRLCLLQGLGALLVSAYFLIPWRSPVLSPALGGKA